MTELESVREELRITGNALKFVSGAADEFREVLTEVLDLDENPGDTELIRLIREKHGKTGPIPTRWRDFVSCAQYTLEDFGYRLFPEDSK